MFSELNLYMGFIINDLLEVYGDTSRPYKDNHRYLFEFGELKEDLGPIPKLEDIFK